MLKLRVALLCSVLALVGSAAFATPLSVRIDDHDFTFDVPYWAPANWGAVYDFNGTGPDTLSIQSSDPNHYVGSYSYVGKLPTVPTAGNPSGPPPIPYPFIYPVANSMTFGGDLKLDMSFDSSDGPYVDLVTGDSFDISLGGHDGHLMITGQIYSQGFAPLYPNTPPLDIVLLDIVFDEVTLLARINEDRIFLLEGRGRIQTLLGYDVAQDPELPQYGVTFFKFFAEEPQAPIFTDPSYQPDDDYTDVFFGHISGEAGAAAVPEPTTLLALSIGGLALLRRRRNRK